MPTARPTATAFGTPRDSYDREDESQFRAAVDRALRELRVSVGSLIGGTAFFSVKDYGAAGDGSEALGAITAADIAAAAAGGVVLFPPGEYLYEDDYTHTAPVMFAGGVIDVANTFLVEYPHSVTALAGEWFLNVAGGTLDRAQTSVIDNGLNVQQDVSVAGNFYGSRNLNYTSSWDGYVMRVSGESVTGSGSVGAQLNRDSDNGGKAMGYSYLQDEEEMWSHGLDADTTDPHPDFFIHQADVGDFMRICSTGAFIFGYGVGKPDATAGIININNVAGHSLATMLQWNAIEADASITRIMKAIKNGVTVLAANTEGYFGAGRDFSADFPLATKSQASVLLGVASAAPDFADMENGSISLYLDSGDLLAAVKDGVGTTGTVNLGSY